MRTEVNAAIIDQCERADTKLLGRATTPGVEKFLAEGSAEPRHRGDRRAPVSCVG